MITEDEAGHVAYAPQVGDVIRSPQERQAVINRSMSAGTINGRDPQAMPASASAAASTPTRPASVDLPPWSLPGAVYVSESGRYYSQPTTIRSIRASLDTAGTSTTTVTVYVNGVSADTITLTSGTTTTTKAVSITVPALGYLKVGVTTAGTGAEDLTVQLT